MPERKPSPAFMAQRHTPTAGALDFFPTPPWALRALFEQWRPPSGVLVWEPAAGRGDLALCLRELGHPVVASDVVEWPPLPGFSLSFKEDFLVARRPPLVRAIITNPPYVKGTDFAVRAIRMVPYVALLVKVAFLEGQDRYNRLWAKPDTRPDLFVVFSSRLHMVREKTQKQSGSAIAYAWAVWDSRLAAGRAAGTRVVHIPPGRQARLEREEDYR